MNSNRPPFKQEWKDLKEGEIFRAAYPLVSDELKRVEGSIMSGVHLKDDNGTAKIAELIGKRKGILWLLNLEDQLEGDKQDEE